MSKSESKSRDGSRDKGKVAGSLLIAALGIVLLVFISRWWCELFFLWLDIEPRTKSGVRNED